MYCLEYRRRRKVIAPARTQITSRDWVCARRTGRPHRWPSGVVRKTLTKCFVSVANPARRQQTVEQLARQRLGDDDECAHPMKSTSAISANTGLRQDRTTRWNTTGAPVASSANRKRADTRRRSSSCNQTAPGQSSGDREAKRNYPTE